MSVHDVVGVPSNSNHDRKDAPPDFDSLLEWAVWCVQDRLDMDDDTQHARQWAPCLGTSSLIADHYDDTFGDLADEDPVTWRRTG